MDYLEYYHLSYLGQNYCLIGTILFEQSWIRNERMIQLFFLSETHTSPLYQNWTELIAYTILFILFVSILFGETLYVSENTLTTISTW